MTGPAERLKRCETAEEYFALLGVPYDPRVLAVNRLHILRHFAAAVAELGAAGTPEAYRDALARSYRAFTTGTALDHRLFKVLREHAPAAFVAAADVAVLRGR